MDTQPGYPVLRYLTRNPSSWRGASHIGSQGKEAISVTHDTLPQVVKASTLYYEKIKKHMYRKSQAINKCSHLTGGQIDCITPPPSDYHYVISRVNLNYVNNDGRCHVSLSQGQSRPFFIQLLSSHSIQTKWQSTPLEYLNLPRLTKESHTEGLETLGRGVSLGSLISRGFGLAQGGDAQPSQFP